MSPDDARHGQRAGYTAGCRCEPCSTAHARYCKQYKWRTSKGPVTVAIEDVRAHLDPLLERTTLTAVAYAAGMSSGHLVRLLDGRAKRVHAGTAKRLLAVTFDSIAASQYVSSVGTRRRIQALGFLGYPLEEITRRTGYAKCNIMRVIDGRRDYVTADVHRRIAAVYDELSMTIPVGRDKYERGAITRAQKRARREGWLPPLAWDDIDDPHERPVAGYLHRRRDEIDEVTVQRLLDGQDVHSSRAEKDEAMRRWVARGGSKRSFAAMHGWKEGRYGKGEAA